jgi:hypothetical protein
MIGLGGERRSHWNSELMPDERVLHYWDAKRFAGSWFAKEVQGKLGYTWDTYFLYGPEATWDRVPEPLLSTGRTILDTGPELQNKLAPLIKE